MTVHPRLRGELNVDGLAAMDKYGSSPLTRGTPMLTTAGHSHYRFIPAYAGNSELGNQYYLRDSVHPRLRGELT